MGSCCGGVDRQRDRSIEGREWAGPLAGSAASVLLILTVLVAAHKQRERDCAIERVLEGDERVPIAAVQRQRRRLLAEQTRNGLAAISRI